MRCHLLRWVIWSEHIIGLEVAFSAGCMPAVCGASQLRVVGAGGGLDSDFSYAYSEFVGWIFYNRLRDFVRTPRRLVC